MQHDPSFKMVPTFITQAESLRIFMAGLSYFPQRVNGGFYTDEKFLKANRVVSTRTAIRLHNLSRRGWYQVGEDKFAPRGVNMNWTLTEEGVNYMLGLKLVHTVKLSPSRKAPNGIKLMGNMIRPVQPEYLKAIGIY